MTLQDQHEFLFLRSLLVTSSKALVPSLRPRRTAFAAGMKRRAEDRAGDRRGAGASSEHGSRIRCVTTKVETREVCRGKDAKDTAKRFLFDGKWSFLMILL